MLYDLAHVRELCSEVGLPSSPISSNIIQVNLGGDAVLEILNWEAESNCLIGFAGTPWHFHGDTIFADGRGYYVDVDYLNIISGLADGTILICEVWVSGNLADRELIHCAFNDEFKYTQQGEEFRIRRAATILCPAS
jgi:hypothetical protein